MHKKTMFILILFLSVFRCYEYSNNEFRVPYYQRPHKEESSDEESSISAEENAPVAFQPYSRSITHGKLMTNPTNFGEVIRHEFDDVGKELKNKLTGQIEHARGAVYDKERFKQVFYIKKHIVSDGLKKVVNINIKEKIVPRDNIELDRSDIGMKALLGGILFLLAGLVFTTTVKMYQNLAKKKIFAEKKSNN